MIHDLKPYPAMKDSGVPWLGQVPEHWEVRRLGSVLKERGEVNHNRQVTEVLSVMKDIGVIPYADKGNVGNKKSDEIERYKVVRPNDLVMNSMNVIIGSVGMSRYTGCLSQVYYVLERRHIKNDPRYIELVFRNRAVQHSLTRIGNGILAHRMRIPMELLKSEPFLLPTPDEQLAIVRFLDHADRRIRKAIAAKQKLIKLLQEQKQVIIHQAVTRGLDPNVKLKPSGVEWLGDVPEGWEVKRLKNVCHFMYGDALPQEARVAGLVEVFGSNGSVGSHNIANTMKPVIVVGRKGSFGKINYSLEPVFVIDTAFFVDSRSTGSNIKWLSYALSLLQLDRASKDSAVPSLDRNDAYEKLMVVPPQEEQEAIVCYIEAETAKSDQAIARAQSEISLLREYRTRLIADVVTGKLDVRDAAAQLPELTDEALPAELDDVEDAEADELDTDGAED